jgi:hypothetical protein
MSRALFYYPRHGRRFDVAQAIGWIRCLRRIGNLPASRRWERWLLAQIR